ncbi:MAG: MFS transporter [Hyphomicrobiaceae bacterium]
MSETEPAASRSAARLVVLVCTAQVLAQIGAFTWPAILPRMMALWQLTNSEAGWVTAAFYLAYMLAVPILVTLTDRIDAKAVYLLGVALILVGHFVFAFLADGLWSAVAARALTGMGWAGTYMTGLKLLADRIDKSLMSRAVAGHAASIGLSGAASFLFADTLANLYGWQSAFLASALCAVAAWLIVAVFAPWKPKRVAVAAPPTAAKQPALFDFRPVFANRSAMAYACVYCIHTLEMNALRGWGVAFLAYVAAKTNTTSTWLTPAVVITALGLLGTLASVLGNEASIRLGRQRLIRLAMIGSIAIAAVIGFVGPLSYTLAASLLLVYGVFIWLDSSSLTAGAAGTAEPSRRGATLAVHSMLGYSGGFVGPIVVGVTLDLAGSASDLAWGLAFLQVALLMLGAYAVFKWLDPRGLDGDRKA